MATNNKILEIDKDTKLVYVDSKHRYYINPEEIEEDGEITYKEDRNQEISSYHGSTTILSVLDKPALIPWAVKQGVEYVRKETEGKPVISGEELGEILDNAKTKWREVRDLTAKIGTAVHHIAEAYAKHLNGKITEEVYNALFQEELGSVEQEADKNKILGGATAFSKWLEELDVKILDTEVLVANKDLKHATMIDAIIQEEGKIGIIDYKTSNGVYLDHALQIASGNLAYEKTTGKTVDFHYVVQFVKDTGEFHIYRFDKEQIEELTKIFIDTANLYNSKKVGEKIIKLIKE